MGKAVDLHFNKDGQRTRESSDMDLLRENIFCDEMGAPYNGGDFGWLKNRFGLESTSDGADKWVHLDVREFDSKLYLKDEFFVKTNDDKCFNKSIFLINNH